MKRISLLAGIVLLAFLATVAVGNHSANGTDKPPVVAWKAVPYSPVVVGGGNPLPGFNELAGLSFTVPEAGFVWLNSSGFCTFSGTSAIVGIRIGWRLNATSLTQPGDASFNNIPTTTTSGGDLPYSASAVFPVSAGTNTLILGIFIPLGGAPTLVTCQGVNVVMFTNTQLP